MMGLKGAGDNCHDFHPEVFTDESDSIFGRKGRTPETWLTLSQRGDTPALHFCSLACVSAYTERTVESSVA